MRGAAFLSGIEDALVVDVGGTTSDVGSLKAGFPREANNVVEVGGVRTLFRMPDLLSIGLGGGSLVEGAAVGSPKRRISVDGKSTGLRRRHSRRRRTSRWVLVSSISATGPG